MELDSKIALLYDKDSSVAYKNLQELESFSDTAEGLYPYFDEFLAMLGSEKYVLRVRGFRLLCKQAKWDTENKIDREIESILRAVDDEKPTAVRQKLTALEDIVRYKKALHSKIRDKMLSLDYLRFKDTMHSLIEQDIQSLLQVMERK
ncbi:hypothetical protein [Oscillibacter sp.]|uniref:hypothetical protein n=1 Tax=Oscillibacter sp. TaxID=1945593 RepID=UPI00289C93BE|nr:hypothetical protein [Oscillibacter sp.]